MTEQQQAVAREKKANALDHPRTNGLHADVQLFAGVKDEDGAGPHGIKDAGSNVNWYRNELQAAQSTCTAPDSFTRRFLQNRLTFAAAYSFDDASFDPDAVLAAEVLRKEVEEKERKAEKQKKKKKKRKADIDDDGDADMDDNGDAAFAAEIDALAV